jgi:hypothetical protein
MLDLTSKARQRLLTYDFLNAAACHPLREMADGLSIGLPI